MPRELKRRDWLSVALSAAVIVVYLLLVIVQGSSLWVDRLDRALMDPVLDLRRPWLTTLARDVEDLASGWSIHLLRWSAIVALVAVRRFRHLVVLLVATSLAEFLASGLVELFQRERPYGVEILGTWSGYSHPSLPVVALTAVLAGICLAIAPAGRIRAVAVGASHVVVAAVGLARVYLGSDHPSDVLFGALLTVTTVVLVFRMLTPEQVFPVSYRRGRTAHLALDPTRTAAIHTAISEQLGLDVLAIEPVGLAGSAGSTPLRLTVAGDPERNLFAKLYAQNHVRSDRWYKLAREILYGRLEDETRFSTVRRLVQYEDYVMRVMRDSGVAVVATHGIVEITPEREYLLVTNFLDAAREIGDPELEIDDGVLDEGLRTVRAMWDAGLAHRDIKPANIMVCNGHVFLIDVAFAQIRPSAWREAVDLANMMLVLALKTDSRRVYERALRWFAPDEIAEAFAATRGVTSPTQLRGLMRADGRKLIAEFQALAPPHEPIPIQRWTLRRFGLLVATGLTIMFCTIFVVSNLVTVPR